MVPFSLSPQWTRNREGGGEISLFTGPAGKPGGASRFPLSLKTDGVFNTKLSKKKKKTGPEGKPGGESRFPLSLIN